MRRLYRIIIYLGTFTCFFLLAASFSFAQCLTGLGVTPNDVDICSGDRVSVTIQGTELGHYYQLRNESEEALSGIFPGTGSSLTIESSPISSDLTIRVYVARASPVCSNYLAEKVIVTVRQPPTVADAGSGGVWCNVGNYFLSGNTPTVGTGKWTIEGPANGATFFNGDDTSPNAQLTGLSVGASIVLRWTISNGSCPASYDEITITRSSGPPPAFAGADIVQCDDPVFVMAATKPPSASGTWSFVSPPGDAVIADTSSPSTPVTNVAPGSSITLRWTLNNGCAPPTHDDVVITNQARPTAASAGSDQLNLCGVTSTTLAANTPIVGTGSWSIVEGVDGDVIDESNPASVFTGIAGDTYVLKWTVSNGTCADSEDVVTIRFDRPPGPAIAGDDVLQCNNGTFLLNATNPSVGVGQWSKVFSGDPGTITNPNSFNTTVTGVTAGSSVTLRWTVSNGSCTAVSDEITLTNKTLPLAILSSDDADNTICSGTEVTFTANAGEVHYEFFVNGSSAQAGTDNTFITSGLANGDVVTVRVTNASGCSTLSAGIATTVNPVPAVTLVSNDTDNKICEGSAIRFTATPVGMSTYRFRVNGTIKQSGPDNVFETDVLADGDEVDVEVETGSGCTAIASAITISVDEPRTVAVAGGDILQCNDNTFEMSANDPGAGETATWSVISGSASVPDVNSPTALVTTSDYEPVILRWTISKAGGICAPSFDEVLIRNQASPTVSDAGGDQDVCGAMTSLNANAVSAGETGYWSFAPGGEGDGSGVISDPASRTSVFSGTAGQTYVLRWSITNNICPPDVDDVEIRFEDTPGVADAGVDLDVCGTSVTLSANTPATGGGKWTINSGGVGTFNDDTAPSTVFHGSAGGSYELKWTLDNGVCPDSEDIVKVRFDQLPVTADAGSDREVCGSSLTLAGNSASGMGQWSVVSGSDGSFVNAANPTTVFYGVPGTVYVLRWTIASVFGACTSASDDVLIDLSSTPTTANAGPDQSLCGATTTNLSANTPTVGTGEWTVLSGDGGSFDDPSDPNTVFYGSAGTRYILRWTISSGVCPDSDDDVVIDFKAVPVAAALPETICSGNSTNIAIENSNDITGTTFHWVVQSVSNVSGASAGGGNVINQLLKATDGVNPGNVTYRITPVADGCPGLPLDVVVTVNPVPVITNPAAAFSKQICSEAPLTFEPSSSISTGTTYSWTTAITGPIDPASVSSTSGEINDILINVGNAEGIVTYHITPEHNGCEGAPVDLVVTVKPLPSASASDLVICSGQTASISIDASPKNVVGTTFFWTAMATTNISGAADGNGSTINQALTTTNETIGTVTYTITPWANGCAGPSQVVTATVNPVATVDVRGDYSECESASFVIDGRIGGSASTGTWSVEYGFGSISNSTTTLNEVTAVYEIDSEDVGALVMLRLTTDDPDGLGPCSHASDVVAVTINRAPGVRVPEDFTVCEPASIILTGDLDPSATSGSWSVLSGGGTLSVSSITGEEVAARYSPAPSDIGNAVSFRLTTNDPDGLGPCVPAFEDITITINESAKVDAGPPQAVCEDAVIKLEGITDGPVSSVAWSGGTDTQFTTPDDEASFYTLTPADIANGSVTFTLTTNDPDADGPCESSSDDVTIRINKLPTVGLAGLDPFYAENDPDVDLIGFPSNDGVFTGPGVFAGTNKFFPSNAGVGEKEIRFTHTDANGCTNYAVATTLINPVTDIEFLIEEPSEVDDAGRLIICENSGNNNLLRLKGIPEWNDPSSRQNETFFTSSDEELESRIVFDGSHYLINTKDLPGGQYVIQYVFTNTLGATSTLSKYLIVNSAPTAIIDVSNSCIENEITFNDNSVIGNNLSGGQISKWSWSYGEAGNGNDGVSRYPTYRYTTEGFKTLTLKVTTDQGCTHSAMEVIRVSNPPRPDFIWSKICVGAEATEFKDISNSGIGDIIQYAWNFADGDTLGFGAPGKFIPGDKHDGRTSNTYQHPRHHYEDFRVYNVKLTIKTDDGCENSVTKRIYILDSDKPTSADGYYENFESGRGTWVETSSHVDVNKTDQYSWVFGTPAGDEINRAYSGVNAWWTGGNSNAAGDFSTYFPNDSTEVTGPCLDLRDIERPMISLNYWAHSQENFDGAVVQYSVNGGATWRTVGDAEKRGINWYNSKNLPGAVGGENRFAWSGKTDGWRNARFSLDEIPPSERDLVIFRIAFGSNNDNQPGSILNGFAFDDIYIGEKKRTVLVEQFVNSNLLHSDQARTYLDNLFDNQTASGLKSKSDFIPIQYHLAKGGFDQLNADNPTDPSIRAFVYNLDTPPVTVMDGILGASPYNGANNIVTQFDGGHALINAVEIDRRALDDPKFRIDVEMDMTQSPNTPLTANVTFTYMDSVKTLTTPVIFNAALVETDISGNKNVLRKLLWEGGATGNTTWVEGTSITLPINYTVDVPVTDPDNLYLIVFVQEKATNDKKSTHILQSFMTKAPAKFGRLPVGIEDGSMTAEISDIRVYPNPASRFVNFSLDNPLTGDYTYRIIDQRGVSILEGDLNDDLRTPQEVALSPLSNGIYFVQFRTAGRVVTYRKVAVVNR